MLFLIITGSIVVILVLLYIFVFRPRKNKKRQEAKLRFINANHDEEYAKFEGDVVEEVKENNFEELPQEMFELTQQDERIFDKKFETKAVGYWKDAVKRFCKSKSSVICFFLLAIIVILSIIGEPIGGRSSTEQNVRLKNLRPKVPLLCNIGIFNGTTTKDTMVNNIVFAVDEAGNKLETFKYQNIIDGLDTKWYKPAEYNIDFVTKQEQYDSRYITKIKKVTLVEKYEQVRGEDGGVIYETDAEGNVLYDENGKMVVKLEPKFYYTATIEYDTYTFLMASYQKSRIKVEDAINYLTPLYHIYDEEITLEKLLAYIDKDTLKTGVPSTERASEINQKIAADLGIDISELGVYFVSVMRSNKGMSVDLVVDPVLSGEMTPHTYFIFGTDDLGIDMWSRIWSGLGLSMLIGLVVGVFCIIFGICWGAISGYYGGLVDIAMERFTDILVNVPSMIILTLLQFYMENKLIVFILALTMTSWVGIASRTRIQFYRYKNREYVLASRTMGAKDGRLIFKHILPNGIGPLVNSAVAIIPASMRFETSMTYLGIASLSQNSIGQIISAASDSLTTAPYLLVIPSVIFSIIMVSFSVLGLGLRDALNPALRGS